MKANKMSSKGFLKGEEETDCFDNEEYIKLQISTLKKVDVICNILNRLVNGTLKANANKLQQHLNIMFDSTLYKILSLVGVLWTIISIPLFFI